VEVRERIVTLYRAWKDGLVTEWEYMWGVFWLEVVALLERRRMCPPSVPPARRLGGRKGRGGII
jgi:hypothetical protein